VKELASRIGSVAILITAFGSTIPAADGQADEAAIRDVVQTRQQQAWNQHDARAYAALFAEDGEVVNVLAGGGGVVRRLKVSSPMLLRLFFEKAR
jgi:hypothetical protein